MDQKNILFFENPNKPYTMVDLYLNDNHTQWLIYT